MLWPPYFFTKEDIFGAPRGVITQDHSESLTGVKGVILTPGKGPRYWFSPHCSRAFTPSPWVMERVSAAPFLEGFIPHSSDSELLWPLILITGSQQNSNGNAGVSGAKRLPILESWFCRLLTVLYLVFLVKGNNQSTDYFRRLVRMLTTNL